MITPKQYKKLFEKLGKGEKLTDTEMQQLREFEAWMNAQKYKRS